MPPKRAYVRKVSPEEAGSPDSPLSSVNSSDHYDDEPADDADEVESRPSKRLKLTDEAATPKTLPAAAEDHDDAEGAGEAPDIEGMSEVSEDTDGDIPYSPNFSHTRYEEEDFQEQITACAWDGCDAGDQGNMDKLVTHIHNEHIESRQKKYTCEWIGCSRKSMPHASGYALKAHMRSHTREKPFYCYLPECDRAFTRSDALAKHMRTVHETEALRPSDPIPKSHLGGNGKPKQLKIIIKTPQSHSTVGGRDDGDPADDDGAGSDSDKERYTVLNPKDFTEKELLYPLKELYARCRIQVKLAERESDRLLEEIQELEKQYKEEWLAKESLFAQATTVEMDYHERRKAITSGAVNIQVSTSSGPADGPVQDDGHINGTSVVAGDD